MIGAEHVEVEVEAALELVVVIGDITGEVGVAAIGLHQRAVHVVAEIRRTEQRLVPVFPLVLVMPLGAGQPAFVDQALFPQDLDRGRDLIGPALGERALREEHIVPDPQLLEVRLDLLEQHFNRDLARNRQVFLFRLPHQHVAMGLGEPLPDRDHVVAWIKAFGDLADILAQRLPVAQVGRAPELVDLGAGIVHVVFAHHLVAGLLEHIGQRIAEHRAAAMADMHRPRRVGGNVFDLRALARAEVRRAESCTRRNDVPHELPPPCVREANVEEARPRNLDSVDVAVPFEARGQRHRDVPGLLSGALGQHHRRVRGHIAVRRVPRLLDVHAREIEIPRQRSVILQSGKRRCDLIRDIAIDVHP